MITFHKFYNHAIQDKSRMLYVIWLIDSRDECWETSDISFPLKEKRTGKKFKLSVYLTRNYSFAHHRTDAGRYAHKLYCCRLSRGTVALKKAFARLVAMSKRDCLGILHKIMNDYMYDILEYPEE